MTSLSSTAIADAAAILLARRAAGCTGPVLPAHCRPSGPDDAFAIQSALLAQSGERIGGWKCALPDGERPIAAPIPESLIWRGADRCTLSPRAGHARVEPELAFRIGKDLPPRAQPYTAADIDDVIVATHLALELVGSRYDDPELVAYPDHLADSLLNQGLFIGPEVDGAAARSASALALKLRGGAHAEFNRDIDGRHPAGMPRAPLAWLAEFLRATGRGLQAGQFIITGTYAGCLELPLATALTLSYGTLGSLTVTFEPQ